MSGEGEEVRMNPVEKLRVRMASEGYQSMEGNNTNNNNRERDSLVENGASQKNGASKSSKGFSLMEQVMAVLLVVFLVVIFALSVLLIVRHFNCDKTKQCDSAECVEISGALLKNMDLSADPCDDFYQYACGSFNDDPLIPPSSKKYSWFSFMNTRASALSKKVLDEKGHIFQGMNSSAIEKAKRFYNVCLNVTATEDLGTTPLLQWIGELGSWTATSDEYSGTWRAADFDLEETLARMYRHSLPPLLLMLVGPDEKENTVNRIVFDQYGLSLSDYTNYLGNSSQIYHQVYSQFFVKVVTVLGGNTLQAEEIAQDLWDFESNIAKIMDRPEDRQDSNVLYNKMTVGDLQQLIDPGGDVFDLSEFLEDVFMERVPSTEEIVVKAPNYFSKLGALIRDTDKKTLANYMVWRAVQEVMLVMPNNLQAAALQARSALQGTQGEDPVWLQCVGLTTAVMPEAVGALYVNTYFDTEDKHSVEDLLTSIVDQFKGRLPKNPWMDDETIRRATEKVEALTFKIGYPTFILQPEKLDQLFERLIVENTTTFDNYRNSMKFSALRAFEKRGKPFDPSEWILGPTQANAYYSPLINEMVFPAAILDRPFFSRAFPMNNFFTAQFGAKRSNGAMNFGSMGFIMGHELTHGFDNRGSQYDSHGNLVNWWSAYSAKHFYEKIGCLLNQYSQYTVQGQPLNGLTTLGENIADNGGMRTSYKAYQAWMKINGYEEERARLPGLNTTENQLFFLSFAQTWCAYYTPKYAIQSLVTDVHSYARYRVIGTLSNSEEFSSAYSCPQGSTMNPEDKCTVW